jgi:glutamate dehydrogenase (NADP+)
MIMGWMADEYSQIVGSVSPAVITGKPIELGGSLGRGDATARGGYYLVCHLRERLDLPARLRVAVQGFGNAGQYVASLLAADGHQVVAVSDSSGAIARPDGLDVAALIKAKAAGHSVPSQAAAQDAEAIEPAAVLATDCDLLVPAALEDMITRDNAGTIRARVLLELANGPVTPDADAILEQRGIVVLPDILANAGGVTVSYFEWVQNRQGFYWDLEEVHRRLRRSMEREGQAVWEIATTKRISMRSAAYVHALSRLAAAIEAHGTQSFFIS